MQKFLTGARNASRWRVLSVADADFRTAVLTPTRAFTRPLSNGAATVRDATGSGHTGVTIGFTSAARSPKGLNPARW